MLLGLMWVVVVEHTPLLSVCVSRLEGLQSLFCPWSMRRLLRETYEPELLAPQTVLTVAAPTQTVVEVRKNRATVCSQHSSVEPRWPVACSARCHVHAWKTLCSVARL